MAEYKPFYYGAKTAEQSTLLSLEAQKNDNSNTSVKYFRMTLFDI